MAVCPFHNDKNPSMKVDRRFHCFGCQADGDVIDFASRFHGIGAKEAALLLAQDFSVPYEDRGNAPKSRIRPKLRQESEKQQFRRMERHCFKVLSDYYHLLRRWKRSMPHASRTGNGTRCLWKPCNGKVMWNICWTCCSPRISGSGRHLSSNMERK